MAKNNTNPALTEEELAAKAEAEAKAKAEEEQARAKAEAEAQAKAEEEAKARAEAEAKAKADADAAPKKTLFSLSELAEKHRLPGWHVAALHKMMGWQEGKLVSEAAYAKALNGLKNRRCGG